MEKTRIVYKNYWRDGNIFDYSSQHPQHPAIDSQLDTLLQFYRSRYGTGSGNGLFVIDSSNKYIDFDEGGAEMTAVLTEGTYNGNSLAAEVQTQLNAQSGGFTASYSETDARFTISDSGAFTLRWNTGTNSANSAGSTLGFDVSADDSGSSSYESDYRRIHYPACYASNNLSGAYSIDFIAILNHNISSSATIKAIGADDEDFTTNKVEEIVTYNENDIFYFFDSAETKQYWKIEIQDPANPNSYIQYGHILLGTYTELNKAYGKDHEDGPEDRSEEEYSSSLVLYGEKKESLQTWTLPYIGLNDASKSYIKDMLEEVGRVKSWIICFDYTSPNSNSYYVRNAEIIKPQYKHVDNWNWTASIIEVL